MIEYNIGTLYQRQLYKLSLARVADKLEEGHYTVLFDPSLFQLTNSLDGDVERSNLSNAPRSRTVVEKECKCGTAVRRSSNGVALCNGTGKNVMVMYEQSVVVVKE